MTRGILPPARDAATVNNKDQRGITRPTGQCDAGTFESQGFTLGSLTGTPQSAAVNTAFSTPLGLTVTASDSGVPVTGLVVTFTAPASGASAVLSGSPVTVGADGKASMTATANGTIGSYNVTASAIGASSVNFALANCSNLITVTNADDNGVGSLRQAIADVCAGGTILFDGDYTIPLASTLGIDKNMTIDGAEHTVTISGDVNNDNTGETRIFYVNTGATFTLQNLTVTKGHSGTNGGGLTSNYGATTTVNNVTFSDNHALVRGGAIQNYSTLTVNNSTFSGNIADTYRRRDSHQQRHSNGHQQYLLQ